MVIVFEDTSTERELAAIGYDRLTKYVYRASWSTTAVEHFLYFESDPRQYFVADFGLRNLDADEFGIETIGKYGHPNFQLWLRHRDAATACSMTFGFGRLDKFSRRLWPRVCLPEITGYDLAILVGGFVSRNLFPHIKGITDLQAYLAFLLSDQEPHPWLASNLVIRAAQVVAVSVQLGRDKAETRELLRPQARRIENGMRHAAITMTFDTYVDKLFSDWASRMS